MLALQLLTSTKTNMVALELMRHLGINDKSAWRMKHKIMQITGHVPQMQLPQRITGMSN